MVVLDCLYLVFFAFCLVCILSVLTFCHICILSNLYFVTDSLHPAQARVVSFISIVHPKHPSINLLPECQNVSNCDS